MYNTAMMFVDQKQGEKMQHEYHYGYSVDDVNEEIDALNLHPFRKSVVKMDYRFLLKENHIRLFHGLLNDESGLELFETDYIHNVMTNDDIPDGLFDTLSSLSYKLINKEIKTVNKKHDAVIVTAKIHRQKEYILLLLETTNI